MKIIILTGNEMRHRFFRIRVAFEKDITVLKTYCEGEEFSLENRIKKNSYESDLLRNHVKSRSQSESDFFSEIISLLPDYSSPVNIPKGRINDLSVVGQILSLNPDLLICYGSSIIKSNLLDKFKGRFLNVHLGLSPYYRGSGTNVWPLINKEPEYIGATFMYIDEGIDTGQIIHQIRADIFIGDTPHTIGNRLILKMTKVFIIIIRSQNRLTIENQIQSSSNYYTRKHFDLVACQKLYDNFKSTMIEEFLRNRVNREVKIIENKGLDG